MVATSLTGTAYHLPEQELLTLVHPMVATSLTGTGSGCH